MIIYALFTFKKNLTLIIIVAYTLLTFIAVYIVLIGLIEKEKIPTLELGRAMNLFIKLPEAGYSWHDFSIGGLMGIVISWLGCTSSFLKLKQNSLRNKLIKYTYLIWSIIFTVSILITSFTLGV